VAAYVTFTGTRHEAEVLIRQLPAMVAGSIPDPHGYTLPIQLRAGVALLSQIQQDFVTKARGGTGRDGIKWAALKPETIARRRTTAGERKALGIRKGKRRPSLTREQDQLWRAVYWQTYRRALLDLGEKGAKRMAAAVAWKVVKDRGAKTLVELLGGRAVEILRDTGELFRSLTPGIGDQPSGADGQIFKTPPGALVVGTNKKPQHHQGDPKRGLPARPFWPPDGTIPSAWWPAIDAAIVTGFVEVIRVILSGAK